MDAHTSVRPIIVRRLKCLRVYLTTFLLFIVVYETLLVRSTWLVIAPMARSIDKKHIITPRWAKASYTQKPWWAKMNNSMFFSRYLSETHIRMKELQRRFEIHINTNCITILISIYWSIVSRMGDVILIYLGFDIIVI